MLSWPGVQMPTSALRPNRERGLHESSGSADLAVLKPYSPAALADLASGLVRRLEGPEDLPHLQPWLTECGVTLVIELPLRNSKMDGVVSFSTGSPIIGLSTRGNRMDSFVFTLLHEIAHLTLGHISRGELRIDEDLESPDVSDRERQANETAARWIFDPAPELPAGTLTAPTLLRVARANGVHPCFLIGRLQKEGRLGWNQYRNTIPKVRPFVTIG